MRKLLVYGYAIGALLSVVLFVDTAGAGLEGPDEFGGHGDQQCEPMAHLSYYDPRRDGQTVYDQDRPNGDNTYYVDDEPLLGFQPYGNYTPGPSPDDCEGTPVIRTTAYAGITVIGGSEPEDKHVGYPMCPRVPGDTRNPHCESEKTGVRAAFYVATPEPSQEVGYSFGVTVP